MLRTFRASDFASSAYHEEVFGPDHVLHYESQWQLSRNDPGFLPWDAVELKGIVADTWFTDAFLDEWQYDIAEDDVAVFRVRVRYRDNYGIVSPWADPLVLSINETRKALERAWAFVLDGHIFYVQNRLLEPALVCDLTTGQWHTWYKDEVLELETPAASYWNMFRGIVWKGRVIAADVGAAKIWELDPHSMLDEETIPIRRAVTAFQPLRGSHSMRQGALRVTARKENLAEDATVTMRFSDDGGKTWSADRAVTLNGGSISKRIEYRSLGRLRAPGRIWEIEDVGGLVRIEGADADMEGDE